MPDNDRIDRIERNLDRLAALVADMGDGLRRLERIAGVLLINDEDLDRRLGELEARGPRKPQ